MYFLHFLQFCVSPFPYYKHIMLNFIRNLVAAKDLDELARWRTNWESYRQWLSEFPMIAMMLDNMNNEVRGKAWMDACHPPHDKGPWSIDNLRWHLRRMFRGETIANEVLDHWVCKKNPNLEETKKLQDRIDQLEKEQTEHADLLLNKNREVNELRFVCGEAYQQLERYRRPNLKALENLYAASNGIPIPHKSSMSEQTN